jgi:hypothetical protein
MYFPGYLPGMQCDNTVLQKGCECDHIRCFESLLSWLVSSLLLIDRKRSEVTHMIFSHALHARAFSGPGKYRSLPLNGYFKVKVPMYAYVQFQKKPGPKNPPAFVNVCEKA